MNKQELKDILKEKYNQIEKIDNEIKQLMVDYGTSNTIFKKGDQVTSSTFIYNSNIVLECTGEFDYSLKSDNIFVDCIVISTNSDIIKLDTVFSIAEKYLKLNN